MPADPSKTTKRRLAAVVSTDAIGYSRLMSENEEATIEARGEAREVFRSHIASHEGRVVLRAYRLIPRDPHDPNLWLFEMVRAWGWMSLGDFERASEQAERSVRRPMAGFPAWGTLASALGHLRRIDEARSALAKTRELQAEFSPQLFDRVWPNMEAAFFERFIDGLRLIDPTIPDPRLATSRPASRSITGSTPDRRSV